MNWIYSLLLLACMLLLFWNNSIVGGGTYAWMMEIILILSAIAGDLLDSNPSLTKRSYRGMVLGGIFGLFTQAMVLVALLIDLRFHNH